MGDTTQQNTYFSSHVEDIERLESMNCFLFNMVGDQSEYALNSKEALSIKDKIGEKSIIKFFD